MARKRKTLTPTQQAYKKQVKRIKQFIRRAEKRGYQFDENVIPQQPKRITKQSVERLKKLTPEQLYKKAEYGGEATYGEVVKGTKGREIERKLSAQKAVETRRQRKYLELYREQPELEFQQEDYSYDYYDTNEPDFTVEDSYNQDVTFYDRTVIQYYKQKLTEYNDVASERLLNWFEAVRQSQGDKATAQMIQQAQEAGVGLERKESYDSGKVQEYIGRMMDFLPEAGDFTKQEIMDALEYEESYEEPF